MIKMNIFRGDLSNISATTATVVGNPGLPPELPPPRQLRRTIDSRAPITPLLGSCVCCFDGWGGLGEPCRWCWQLFNVKMYIKKDFFDPTNIVLDNKYGNLRDDLGSRDFRVALGDANQWLFFQPNYWLDHPENYSFSLSTKMFSGSKYPKTVLFDLFETVAPMISTWMR